jgi:type III pantothenate kinase
MLLVIDVGNTNIVLGLMKDQEVVGRWRVSTKGRTTDEFGLLLKQLLGPEYTQQVTGGIVSCVVPATLYSITKACRRYLQVELMIVGSGVKTGMRVRTDNPREVGADRIVNAVAALSKWKPPLVVVDFGTATTFDCVDANGDYVGGAIAPGLRIAAEALFNKTSKLPMVEVRKPKRVIGTNTIDCIQSGLFYGYQGLVDRLASQCKKELGEDADGQRVFCVATGGFSSLIATSCQAIDEVDESLTLRGLSLLWHRNV